MGINKRNLETLITRPVLADMGEKYYSETAVELLLMTCATESKMGTYLKQGLHNLDDGQARARGIYQMESATHDDVWHRFKWHKTLLYLPDYNSGHFTSLGGQCIICEDIPESFDRLIYDLKYSTIMARAKFWLSPEALPEAGDVDGLAHYYAKHWYAGEHYEDRKQKAIDAYGKYCGELK